MLGSSLVQAVIAFWSHPVLFGKKIIVFINFFQSLKQPRDGVSSLPGGRSQNHRPPRILVCAPTDFGADEIVRRMIRGRLVCDSKKGKELQSSSREFTCTVYQENLAQN